MIVMTVVGARPEFIQCAPVSRALRQHHREYLVHTGQHYDHAMSEVFFDELDLPRPDINLGIGALSNLEQVSRMLLALQPVIGQQRPNWILVYGDTNSTLAGALAGKFMGIPVAHVEAGMRSYNRTMPEETNRILTDHISTVLLCPTPTAVANLARERITQNVFLVNDVTTDSLLYNRKRTSLQILNRCHLQPGQYYLATVHRASNTDNREALAGILDGFAQLQETEIVIPTHPRLRQALERFNLPVSANVRLIDPVGYLEMISLTSAARLVLTDSGGLQKEAYVLEVPCVTLRSDTEWVETVETGWNRLVGTDCAQIVSGVQQALTMTPAVHPAIYGDGHAGERIVEVLASLTP